LAFYWGALWLWLDHDAGYWPDWYDETREYLDAPPCRCQSEVICRMGALWCALTEDLDRDGIGDEWEEHYVGGTMSLTGVVTSASAFFRVWVSEP